MIDCNFKFWLIEINTNPCLETSCPLLKTLIPQILDDTFKICLDPLFLPPYPIMKFKNYTTLKDYYKNNNFELMFDDTED